MAYTVFDAVGKFSADTSQLDQFIAKLEQGLTTASEKAAASTQALKAAQDEFRQSIAAVAAEGGDTADNIQRLAAAEENLALAAAAAKQEHAALKAELAGTKESAGVAAQAADQLGGAMTKMFGIMAAAEGFKALIEHTQQSVLQLQLLSEKTGIAIDTLAGIQHVAEASGVSFDDVAGALTRLARAQALALEGGQQQTLAFQRIGISISQLKQLNPEQLFFAVASAMANAKNHAEENASAFTLLGRGGAALIPIFQQNTEQLRSMVEEAAKASGVTTEAGQAALEWEKQTANLSESMRAGLIPVMEALIPVIKVVEELGSDTAMAIRDLGAAVGGLFLAEFDGIKGITTVFNDVASGQFRKAVNDVKAMAGDVSSDVQGIGLQFKENFQNTATAIKQIWSTTDPLKPLKDDLSDLGNTKSNSKLATAMLDAQKTLGDAVLALLKSQGLEQVEQEKQNYSLRNAATKDAFAQQLSLITQADLQERAIQAKADDDAYQLQLKTLQAKLALLQSEGKDTQAEQVSINAQIEALQFKHQATLIDTYTKMMATLRQTMSQPIPLITAVPEGMDQIQDQVTKGFQQAEDAASTLGLTLRSQLDTGIQAAYDAYSKLETLFHQGIITQKDLNNGYIKLVSAELDFAKATGATADQIARLQKELDQLTGKDTANIDKFGKHAQMTFQQFVADMKNGVSGMQELQQAGVDLFNSLSQSMESAIASAIMGQKTFGQAMEEATAQALASLAAQAIVKALFYTAEGFAALAGFAEGPASEYFEAAAIMGAVGGAAAAAGHALAGAASSGSSSTSKGTAAPAAGSAVTTAQPQPVQVVNVQHMATGGLATQPTLAMVGDAESGGGATEAIIPLDNQNVMRQIAEALMPGLVHALSSEGRDDVAHQPFFPSSAPSLLSASTMRIASASVAAPITQQASTSIEKALNTLATKLPAQAGSAAAAQHDINVTIQSDIPQVIKQINHQVKTGRARLHSSTTDRTIKKTP